MLEVKGFYIDIVLKLDEYVFEVYLNSKYLCQFGSLGRALTYVEKSSLNFS